MRSRLIIFPLLLLSILPCLSLPSVADTPSQELEQAMSDTLDLWREGRFEQVYERLAHRGKISKEQFVRRMAETSIRPACCWRKMEGFSVLSEKRTEAVVYAKVGLEGTPSPVESSTREFKLSHVGGAWKMQLSDITGLAGAAAKKHKYSTRKKNNISTSPY